MKRQLPKNVRQIGNVSDSSKIYVEDYVDTFFNQLCDKAEQEMLGAFLVGEIVQEEEQDYIYVYGAIRMKELKMKGKDFIVEESVWKHACETCKEYFGNAEILGWFVAGGDTPKEANHNVNRIHQKYFPREKSIFITKSARDKEEKFYIYKYHNMMECNGHYIYYEKNVEMQNYMIATRKKVGFTPSEIIEDRVAKNFRTMIREREQKTEQKGHSRMVYALSTVLVLIAIVIGVTMINNYDKMREVEKSFDQVAEKSTEEKEEEAVETMGENVLSQEEQAEDTLPQTDEGSPKLPEEETTTPETTDQTATDVPTETVKETYIVQKGDTLETICKAKYGDVLYIEEICKLNNLEDGNLILIGQKLLLP